jgi:hypothetical protein
MTFQLKILLKRSGVWQIHPKRNDVESVLAAIFLLFKGPGGFFYKPIKNTFIKNFRESKTLFIKRVLAAGGKSWRWILVGASRNASKSLKI